MREVNCAGKVEVGEHFAYFPVDLLLKMTEAVFGSLALQDQDQSVNTLCGKKYGSSIVPPFEPEAMREICHAAGADKLFDSILEAMSTDDPSIGRGKQNEKKVVDAIFMLMFGQSQKANWFQKSHGNEVVSKCVSGTGLFVLMVDDHKNIHTKQGPKYQETLSARSMATVLLNRFCSFPAIHQSENTCNPSVVDSVYC